MPEQSDRIITSVYVYNGNMAMVFDQYGHQMTEYHGSIYEMKQKILMSAPDTAKFYSPVWTDSQCRTEMTREEWSVL